MPFVAKNRNTNVRVDITQYEFPRQELVASDLVCQFCESSMIIRAGEIFRAHFAHKVACSSDSQSHPESPEHLLGKWLIAQKIKEEWKEYSNARIEFEYPVPEVKRVIDIAMVFPNGWIVAHEVQLASITTGELRQRTEDYNRAGIDVVWWLGKSADTPANRDWCINQYGFSLSLNYDMLRARFDNNHVSAMAGSR